MLAITIAIVQRHYVSFIATLSNNSHHLAQKAAKDYGGTHFSWAVYVPRSHGNEREELKTQLSLSYVIKAPSEDTLNIPRKPS